MNRILIADDHPIFLKGLKEVIEEGGEFEVVCSASNGADALEGIITHQPDVAVLDIDMPKMNGLQVAAEGILAKPDLAVIMLTMHQAKDALLKALEIGVLGYVLKENTVLDIVHAIREVMRGQSYISPEMSGFLLKQDAADRKNIPAHIAELLTPAEQKIIAMVGAYKSTREIAEELFISEKTVSNHRMNIVKKLNLTGKNGLLRFAIENFPGK